MLDIGISKTLKVDDNLFIQFVPKIFLIVSNNNLDNQRKILSSQKLEVTE